MEKNMDNTSNEITKDQLINDFKMVVADAEALVKATANTGGEKLAEVRAKAQESLNIAAAAKATDVYVHENPWRSVGFAASIGVVVGLLIGRR
jgi:ElaB/YqjD/DUF883 family membrane-anchored ribosome-binding protein